MNIKSKFLVLLLVVGLVTPLYSSASAQSANNFNSGRIIDDSVFFNSAAMSATEVQNFLNSKVPTCETNHAQGSYPYPPPYICLKDYSTNTENISADSYCSAVGGGVKSAATIIKEVATACSINPQVLLVLLQKEQILITDTWPLPSQYTKATGFGCPDSDLGSDVDANNNNCYDIYEGFFKQVYYGARQYQRYAKQPNLYNFRSGQTFNILYNPNTACGSSAVYLQNQATAGLYNYTPYQPNQAALNNLYGTGNSCSAYGNRNFWRMFRDWFGTTYAPSYAWSILSQYAYTDDTKTVAKSLTNLTPGERVYIGFQAINAGNTTWSNSTNPVRVGTTSPMDRSSSFCDITWLSCGRPANMKESSVAPGATATFEFWYQVPYSGGSFQEYFNLLSEGITWINGPSLNFYSVVPSPNYSWQLVEQFAYTDNTKVTPVNLNGITTAQRVFVGFKARNTGNSVWRNSGRNPTRLGTSSPQDRSSAFYDGTWLGPNRPIDMKESVVKPGEIATFEFWYKPSNVGTFQEYFRPLIEGVTWMNDLGLSFYTRITPASTPSGVDRLNSNQSINRGEFIRSNDGRYRLVMQGDGNLVLYSPNRAIWSSRTNGTPATRLVMQGDGNLVLYSGNGAAVWFTSTHGKGSSSLILQDDGNLVVYSQAGIATWHTSTNGKL